MTQSDRCRLPKLYISSHFFPSRPGTSFAFWSCPVRQHLMRRGAMKKKELIRQLKGVLEKRRAALRQTLNQDIADLRSGTGIEQGDVAEVALDDTFELVSSQLAETESRELAQIEIALERIRRGSYGECRGCGQEIPA